MKRFLVRDGFLLAVATGGFYAFTYGFQRSYLAHFGVDSIFVELSIGQLLQTFFGLSSFTIFAYQMSGLIPKIRIRIIAAMFYIFAMPALFSWFAYTAWRLQGYGWTFIIMLVILAVVIAVFIFPALVVKFKGGTLDDYLDQTIPNEVKFREKFITSSLVDRLPNWAFLTLVAAFVLLFVVAPIAGGWTAGRKSDHAAIDIDGKRYLIVQLVGGTGVAVPVTYTLSGSVPMQAAAGYRSIDISDSYRMYRVQGKVRKHRMSQARSRERTTLSEFLSRFSFGVDRLAPREEGVGEERARTTR